MLRIFMNQDFDHDILRGLRLRMSELNAVTAREAGLDRQSDTGNSCMGGGTAANCGRARPQYNAAPRI